MGDTQIGTRSFLKGIPKTVVGYQACLDRKKRAEAAADRGDLPAAVSLLRENLNWCQANLSKDPMHEMTLWHQESLATHLAQQGEFNEALVHIAEAYDNRNAVEPGGQDTANTLDQYAFVLAKLNQHHLAASKYRLVWEARKKALGEDNPLTLTTGFELACCWFNLGMSGTHREWNIERAKKLHQSILDARERETPPNILAIAMTREELAQDFLELGEYDKARDLASKNVGLLAPWKRRNNGRYPQDQINAVVQSTRQLLSDIDSKIAIRDQQARERRAQEQANLQRRRREMQERRESEELEKAKQESERLEKERLEMEELEKAKWESERLDKERLKMERLEMEELEKAQRESERLEMERLEMERFEMERLEMDRLKKERLERERAEKAKRQRQKREAELKEKKELERKEKEERVRKKRELEIQEQAKRRLERAQAAEDRRKRELQAEAAQTEAEQANQPAQVGGTKAGAPGASVALTTDADGRTLCPPPATTKSDQIMGAAEGDAQNTPKKINQGQFVEKNPETNQHPGRLAPAIETPSVIVRESRPESKQQRNVVPKISTDNSAFVASPSQSPTLHLQPGPPLGSSKQLGRSVSTSKLAGTPKASTPTRPSASNDKLGRRSSDPSLNGEKLSSAKPQPPKRTQSISDSRFETAEDRFNEQRYNVTFSASHVLKRSVLTRIHNSVDRWFRDVRDINEIILDPFRRTAGKRVKVAILDTGVDMNHNIFKNKDIRKRIKKREDFVDGDGDTTDICGHGTHCVAVLNRVAPWADIYVARVAVGFEKGPDPDVVAKVSTDFPSRRYLSAGY